MDLPACLSASGDAASATKVGSESCPRPGRQPRDIHRGKPYIWQQHARTINHPDLDPYIAGCLMLAEGIQLINQASPAITAIATAAIAVLTFILASENRRLRKAGTEPHVVAYLAPHPDGHGGVNFILANVGQGPAKNVKFTLIHDEADFRSHSALLYNEYGRAPLTLLPQGERIASLLGVGYVLFGGSEGQSNTILKPFDVKIDYSDVSGRSMTSIHKIDISQFSGLAGILSKPPSREIAETLNKIEKHFAQAVRQSAAVAALIDTTSLNHSVRQKVFGKQPDRKREEDDSASST